MCASHLSLHWRLRREDWLVRVRPSEAHGRSHLLPAMSSLAGEVGYLVHLKLALLVEVNAGVSECEKGHRV